MGYSARYHAASLAAVFLALAVGILIGVGFGDNLLNSTQKSLEKSLTGDLENARGQADALGAKLNQEREFGQRAYPFLVGRRLRSERVGLIALGGLPSNLSSDIEQALAPTGARLSEVAVVREPPNVDGIASELKRTRFARMATDPGRLQDYAREAGVQLVRGGRLLRRTRDVLLSRASGRSGRVDDVIVVRSPPENVAPADRDPLKRLEAGILDGIHGTGVPAVGVERSDTDPSQVGYLHSGGFSTVDSLDLVSGRVAMVFALLGAEGNFGVKGSADRLLPDLLVRSKQRPARGRR
jgi:hypothetical protein